MQLFFDARDIFQVPYSEPDRIAGNSRTLLFSGLWRGYGACNVDAGIPPIRTVMQAEVALPAAARVRANAKLLGALNASLAAACGLIVDAAVH